MAGGDLMFGLSRSLGRDASFGRARDFAALLDHVGFATVVPYDSYRKLEQALLDGEVDAAWAPPLICARVEQAGGTIAMRAIRSGVPVYGAALLRDFHYRFTVGEMPRLLGLRAAWVDEYSMAGYVLPRHLLRARGIDLDATFSNEMMLGSYEACLLAVLKGQADVTGCYYRDLDGTISHGYARLMGDRARFFNVLALSELTPHDAVAFSPSIDAERRERLRQIFGQVAGSQRAQLAHALDADGFDEPPPGTYRELLALL